MTLRALDVARQLAAGRGVRIIVRFAGGDAAAMQRLYGSDLAYQPQAEGNLGDRLIHAVEAGFADGGRAAVVIGADCPDLDNALLARAFEALREKELVIGPALDGGYYLIGLRQPRAELFRGIDWGSEHVLRQTLAIANRLGLSVFTLPPLTDIDRPEDLAAWPGH